MKNELNLATLKISTFGIDFLGANSVHEKKENKMNTKTKTYIATSNGVETSQFVSVEKADRKKYRKFNEAFMNELEREELFIGALGLAMNEEADEASKITCTTEYVKNIYDRTVRIIKTYSDGSVQVFQVNKAPSNRHYYNGSVHNFKTVKFTTGDNTPVSDNSTDKKLRTPYSVQIRELKSVKTLSRFSVKASLERAKLNAERMYYESKIQAVKI